MVLASEMWIENDNISGLKQGKALRLYGVSVLPPRPGGFVEVAAPQFCSVSMGSPDLE